MKAFFCFLIIAFGPVAFSIAYAQSPTSAPTTTYNLAGAPTTAPMPDITSRNGIRIADKFTAWGGTITISAKMASEVLGSNKYSFRFVYDELNIGNAPTNPLFNNRLLQDNAGVCGQPGQSLAAGQTKNVSGLIPLTLGQHTVTLLLDDANVVKESNENNNKFSITVNVIP